MPKRDARGRVTESGKSQVVIFGENGITTETFSLHGKELEQKRSYKYLGVHMHQLLGKHRGTRDMCPQDYKGKFFYDSDHDELRGVTVRACGSRSSLGVRSRAVGGSVGQISHTAGPHPLSLGVRRYPLFPLGEKQTCGEVSRGQ